jgi:hypothetical protein
MNLSSLIQRLAKFGTSAQAKVLFFIFCLSLTIWVRKNGFDGYQFGQEIGNVSAALADGKGFSNVFDHDSGPTAWTPMFFTSIYGLIFKIFGTKSVYSYWALFFLRSLLLAITFHLATRIDYGTKINRYRFLLLPIFLVFGYFVVLKRGMDDVIFNIFLSMSLMYVISNLFTVGFDKTKLKLYLLALIIPLSNISFFIGLFCFVLLTQLSFQLPRIPRGHALALIIVMVLSMSGWGIRNSYTLNQFIPFKSNLWFELYLSNVKDDDGILKFTNFREYHPLSNSAVKQEYKDLGEIEFMEKYRKEALDYLAKGGFDFIGKAANRAFNIFIWTQFNINNVAPVEVDRLNEKDIEKLEDKKLILNQEWICIDLTKREFESQVAALDLIAPDQVRQDWGDKKKSNRKEKLKRNNLILGFLMSLLPTLAIIVCLVMNDIRRNPMFLLTLGLFLITIGPYLIISFHTRYQLFQMSFYVIFVFLALATLLDRFVPEYLSDKELQVTS